MCWSGVLPESDSRQQVDESLVGLARLWGKPRQPRAHVALLEHSRLVDLAREKTPAKRAEGDEADAKRLEAVEHLRPLCP